MFGEKLKKARIDAGYTQQQVADILKIKQSTLAGYEIGRTQPDFEILGTLADFYCVSLDWLIGTGKNKVNKSQKAIQIHNGNGNMIIELTPEQIRRIKES